RGAHEPAVHESAPCARRPRPPPTSPPAPCTTLFRSTLALRVTFLVVSPGRPMTARSIFSVRAPTLISTAPVHTGGVTPASSSTRSEEHTSELQSRENLVCRPPREKQNVRT